MNSNSSYSPETLKSGHNWRVFVPCDLEIWWMTLKNNRAPLVSNTKPYAPFHHHMWIQTGITVRKRLRWVMTFVTLTFGLWPWPFAWTLLLSLVITPKNFKRCDKQTDGRTDRQTDRKRCSWSCLVAAKTFDASLSSPIRLLSNGLLS